MGETYKYDMHGKWLILPLFIGLCTGNEINYGTNKQPLTITKALQLNSDNTKHILFNILEKTKTIKESKISPVDGKSSIWTYISENDKERTVSNYINRLRHTNAERNYNTRISAANSQNHSVFSISHQNATLSVNQATLEVNSTRNFRLNHVTSTNTTNIKSEYKITFLTPRTVTQSLTNQEFIHTTEWYKSSKDNFEENRTVNIETPDIKESVTEDIEDDSWLSDNHVLVTKQMNFQEAQFETTTSGYNVTKPMDRNLKVTSNGGTRLFPRMFRRQEYTTLDSFTDPRYDGTITEITFPPTESLTWRYAGGGGDDDETTQIRIVAVRTTPFRLSFEENCDYLAYYCLKAYDTGKLCARTLYYTYHDFPNYCMLDYVNCMERYEVWQVAHMGGCFKIEPLQEYKHYPYENDYFLDQYYMLEDLV